MPHGCFYSVVILPHLALLWIRTLRPQFPSPFVLPDTGILTLWHEHMLLCLPAFANRNMRVLVSQSRDGDLGAFACDRLGYNAVRGSSSRGGVSALRNLARELSSHGGWAALIVDGPRGPRQKSKPGAVWLSEKTGIPITAVYAETRPAWRTGNWDQGIIPAPFAHIKLRLSKPGFPKHPEDLDAMMEETARGNISNKSPIFSNQFSIKSGKFLSGGKYEVT